MYKHDAEKGLEQIIGDGDTGLRRMIDEYAKAKCRAAFRYHYADDNPTADFPDEAIEVAISTVFDA